MDKMMHSLRKMHNIERFATEVYGVQIAAFAEKEVAERLRKACDIEQEHVNDLQARIKELGGDTSRLGFLFQMAGKAVGFATRLGGKNFILHIDIRIEEKAVKDYGAFLQTVDFDEKSRSLIQKNIEEEKAHIKMWEDSIELLRK